MGGQNSLDLSAGDRNLLDFTMGLGIGLLIVWAIKVDLVFVYVPKMT